MFLLLSVWLNLSKKSEGDSFIGIKVKEDLGHQTSAFAQLEMGFNANNGMLYTGSRDNGGISNITITNHWWDSVFKMKWDNINYILVVQIHHLTD